MKPLATETIRDAEIESLGMTEAYAHIACVPTVVVSTSCTLVAMLAILMPVAGVPAAVCGMVIDMLIIVLSVPCFASLGVAAVRLNDL